MKLFSHPKCSLGSFLRQGYEIKVYADGDATFTKPDGKQYTVSQFVCDCPNKKARGGGSYNGHCKHELALSQIYICPKCDKWAVLCKITLPTGSESYEFRCPNRHIYTWDQIKDRRKCQTTR